MSSNLLQNDEFGSYSSGSFAPFETAFAQSPQMDDFQEKIIRGSPSASKQHSLCDLISMQSEEKINNGIDEIAGSIYGSAQRPVSVEHFNTQSLSQDLRNLGQNIGKDLRNLGQNIDRDANALMNNVNQNSVNASGMNIWKLLLLIILAIILIYAIYCLFFGGGNDISKKVSEINIFSSKPSAVTLSDTFKGIF